MLAPELAAPVIARLKVLASLDIAEHRLPQDGQFALNLAGRPLSFRIATLPCRYGEKIVLRLLHQVDQALDLEALGLSSSQLAAFRQALNQPQGLLLVTGPTGSGKTVTLYSALQARNREQVNICSVEDPLEIPIAGMNQTQINPRAGLTFHHWHGDMPGLSDKAVVLATSKGCPRQIIRFSPKHYAFQAHLEFDLEAIDLLIAADGEEHLTTK